jgi:hypothetical protein
MASSCPTQVAKKPKTECGNLIRQVKAKAGRIPDSLQENRNLFCKDTNPTRTKNTQVTQPKVSERFANNCPICNDLKMIATMLGTKGANGYPQKSTNLPKESQTLTSFQNDVLKFGRERKYFQASITGSPTDSFYCKTQGLKTQLWKEGQGHKELVAKLNTTKSKGCF